jgi:glycosyltransferase involved in cell wall biosynthesis
LRARPGAQFVETDSRMTPAGPSESIPLTIMINAIHGGGAEYVGRTWAAHLRESGRSVRLVVFQPVSSEMARHLDDGTLSQVEELNQGGRWQRFRNLRRLLRNDTSSAVVSMQMYPNLSAILVRATLARRDRAPLAISERNIVTVYAGRVSLRHRLRVQLARRLYRKADLMLAISHPVAAEMIAGFGVKQSRTRVVPNPAAHKQFPRPSADVGVDGPLELVIVGRLVEQKQPLVAVATASELAARGVATRLVVFGDGPLRAEVEEAAARSGVDLDLRGWVEGWPAQCGPNAVMLLASIKEGFGNVLVEAAAHRIPSVAISGALGVADAVVPGVTGVLASDPRPSVLADAVLAARSCGFAGLDDWLAHFSTDSSVARLLSALDEVTPNRARAAR